MLVTRENGGRGLNVIALEPFKHEVILNAKYDTYGDENASKKFVKDFSKLPKASVIVIGVKEEASKQLSGQAKKLL
jgi:hypothetical protein